MLDRRQVLSASLLSLASLAGARAQTAAPDAGPPVPGWPTPSETIDLWPGRPPGAPATLPEEVTTERSKDPTVHDRFTLGIATPRMAVFRPRQPNGAAILITPGGGYSWVVVDREGYEVAGHFAARGFTCFVLFYRLPHEGWAEGHNVPLSDARRAMRLVRHHAGRFGIDPARVASMGFSAGGHLACDLAARFATETYAPVDAADRLSPRPFLSAPIYPVQSMQPPLVHLPSRKNLIGEDPPEALVRLLSPEENVTEAAPPCFLVHAEDDQIPAENAVRFRAALKAKGVPVEMHLFTEGGHGFAIRRTVGKPVAAWPDLFLAWARARQLVG